MNALYVTVSIPLLLVLAGFNHAHGLTTFGKSPSPNTPQPQKPPEQRKECKVQANCSVTKDTSCVTGFCRCGNDGFPINGKCKENVLKGPFHLCKKTEDCTENADCKPVKEVPGNYTSIYDSNALICACREGFDPADGAKCGGHSNFVVLPGLVLIIVSLSTTLY